MFVELQAAYFILRSWKQNPAANQAWIRTPDLPPLYKRGGMDGADWRKCDIAVNPPRCRPCYLRHSEHQLGKQSIAAVVNPSSLAGKPRNSFETSFRFRIILFFLMIARMLIVDAAG